jgi:hypothetical protein
MLRSDAVSLFVRDEMSLRRCLEPRNFHVPSNEKGFDSTSHHFLQLVKKGRCCWINRYVLGNATKLSQILFAIDHRLRNIDALIQTSGSHSPANQPASNGLAFAINGITANLGSKGIGCGRLRRATGHMHAQLSGTKEDAFLCFGCCSSCQFVAGHSTSQRPGSSQRGSSRGSSRGRGWSSCRL